MQRLLFQALSSAADGAFVRDIEQRIVYWNRAAQRMLGRRSAEVLSRPCYEIFHGQDAQGRPICGRNCAVAVASAADSQVPLLEMLVPTRSGNLRWLSVSTFIFPDDRGDSGHLVVHLFRDITRSKQSADLLRKILAAAAGLQEEGLSPSPLRAPEIDLFEELTEREYEVLSLLARGCSTGEMARALYISTSTVRNHIRNILAKFRVHSRIEAVLYAVKCGLITLQ
jgi:PAS domain S-box-containing protein